MKKQAESSQKEKIQAEMVYEQERISLHQQLEQIKEALKVAEKECHDIRHKLEREVGVVTGGSRDLEYRGWG